MLELTRREKIQSLLFLLLGLALVGSVVAVAVGFPFHERGIVYWLRFKDSVNGLERGTKVRYKGVEVGEVKEISVDPKEVEDVLIKLEVKPGTPVRVSTRAFVSAASLVGPFSIELHASRSTSPILPEGSEIPAETSRLARLLKTGTTVGDHFVKVMENFESLTGQDMKEKLAKLLDSSETTVAQVGAAAESLESALVPIESIARRSDQILAENRDALRELSSNLAEISGQLNEFLRRGELDALSKQARDSLSLADREFAQTNARLRKYLDDNAIGPHLQGAVATLKQTVTRLERSVANLEQEGLAVLRGELTPTLITLRESSRALSDLARRLQGDPSLLIFSSPAAEVPLPTGKKK